MGYLFAGLLLLIFVGVIVETLLEHHPTEKEKIMIEDPMARYSHEQGEQLGDLVATRDTLDVIIRVGWDGSEMVILYGDLEIAREQDADRMTVGEFGGWIAEHVITHQSTTFGYSDAEREQSYSDGRSWLNRAFVRSLRAQCPRRRLPQQEAPEWTI